MDILHLEEIVNNVEYDTLPADWQFSNIKNFSRNKQLFDFQQDALKNAIKALYKFYKSEDEVISKNENELQQIRKKYFFKLYGELNIRGLESLDYKLDPERKEVFKHLLDYDKEFPVEGDKISFEHFINRMNFWMATGSGKTLVIVKLISMLRDLMNLGEMPCKDILFLSHREDLLTQFKNHVEEYNSYHPSNKIILKNLRDFDNIKKNNQIPFSKNEIIIFYYRTDLITDTQKKNKADFRNYDNNGEWYIILDEAHKGKKEESKGQFLYSILSRNGFLFNFSATFTERRDDVTCVFNFNLSKFIQAGYGKNICLFDEGVAGFRKLTDFSPQEKQKTVLKTLVLATYISQYFKKITKKQTGLYHKPLLLTLVNSVNDKESDLGLFFDELHKIANNKIRAGLLVKVKNELLYEFSGNISYKFMDSYFILDHKVLQKIKYKDVLYEIFNSKAAGNFEVLTIRGNNKEAILQVKKSYKPFALVKIGDVSKWIKNREKSYEISEKIGDKSIFEGLDEDNSDINILMGSRAFYEGWDSNRPNIILFINIGVGADAKKFVLQSVGRGVRIEPVKGKRKRISSLYISEELDKDVLGVYDEIKDYVAPLETLFIFGTKPKIIDEIMKTFAKENSEYALENLFTENRDEKLLLIPSYKETDELASGKTNKQQFIISKKDFKISNKLFGYLGEIIILMKYDVEPKFIEQVKDTLNDKQGLGRFNFNEDKNIDNSYLLIDRIFNYFKIKNEYVNAINELNKEIVHFKKIQYKGDSGVEQLTRSIIQVRDYVPVSEDDLKAAFKRGDQDAYDEMQARNSDSKKDFIHDNKAINIHHIQNHYYIPLIVPENEKTDYFIHAINVQSEIDFINELIPYLEEENNFFASYDWWKFSKLDEHLDQIYIPYYNPSGNTMARFKPDFIFWLLKGDEYTILFVDPKGTEHVSSERKIDGFTNIFEERNGDSKEFYYTDTNRSKFKVKVKLLLFNAESAVTSTKKYQKYWFDSLDNLSHKVMI